MTAIPWEPEALATTLGITLPEPEAKVATATRSRNSAQVRAAEPISLEKYPKVMVALDQNTGDRSIDTMRVVSAGYDAGLTLSQTLWAINTREDLAGRLDDRNDDDIWVCWDKVDTARRPHAQTENSTGPVDPVCGHLRDKLLRLPALGGLPVVEPLIEGLLYRDTLAQIAGSPGCYKSFFATGMGCCVATGKAFREFDVPKPGNVMYVAAEGASGLSARVLACCEVWGMDRHVLEEKLQILPLPVALGNPDMVKQAVDLVGENQVVLLILDTRARCTSGLEENSATQQGVAIEAADEIRRAASCTVVNIHHTPRSGNAGRGSNAWDAAIWSDLRMEGGGLKAKITCEKHKDVPSGCTHNFSFKEHTVSADLMPGVGELWRKTLVLERAPGIENLTVNSERVVLEIIRNSAPPEGLSQPTIVGFAEDYGVSKSSVYTAVKSLAARELVRNVGPSRRSSWVLGSEQG